MCNASFGPSRERESTRDVPMGNKVFIMLAVLLAIGSIIFLAVLYAPRDSNPKDFQRPPVLTRDSL